MPKISPIRLAVLIELRLVTERQTQGHSWYPREHCVARVTRSSAIAEGQRDASCQLKSCQLPRNSAETTYTTSPGQIDGMELEI